MFIKKTFNMSESVNFMGRCLALSSHFEMHLQKGPVLCISQRVSLQSSMRGGGALTLSVFDVDLTSVGGMLSVGVCVLLQVWVAGPSRVDATTMLMEAVEVTRVFLTSIDHETANCLVAGSRYPFKVDDICGKFQWPSVYFVVCIFTIEKLL